MDHQQPQAQWVWVAGGMCTTDPRTRIATAVVDAGLHVGTLRVDGALWLALHVGVAGVVPDAGAGGGLAPVRALGIDAARTRVAGLNLLRRWCCGWKEGKMPGSVPKSNQPAISNSQPTNFH